MQVGQPVTGSIWQVGDRGPAVRDTDSFKFSLVANRTYRIEVRGTGESGIDVGGTLADPQLNVGRVVSGAVHYLQGVSADGGAGKNESYTFTATHTSDYFIEVYDGASPDEGGTYTVLVEEVS